MGGSGVLAPTSSALQIRGFAWLGAAEDDFSSCPTLVACQGFCRILPAELAQKPIPVAPTKTTPLAKPRARRFRSGDARMDIVDSHPARPRLGDFDQVLREVHARLAGSTSADAQDAISRRAQGHAVETELCGLRLIGRLGGTGFGRHRSAVFQIEIITRR